MRKVAYILLAVSLILAGMTLMKTNLLASDGKKMQETLSRLRQAEEEAGRLTEEVARAKSVQTVVERAQELGFAGATVKRVEDSANLANLGN